MQKDFDEWNKKKKEINAKPREEILFFREGEIWWVHLGINVGFEMDGKGHEAMRPILIVKKYNQFSFLAIPLSTSLKLNRYRVPLGVIDGKAATANLSQIKNVDSRRLINKITHVERSLLKEVKEKASRVNLS